MTRTMKFLIALSPLLLTAGIAQADSTDDDFLRQVNNVGVTGAPADLIRNAHMVCTGLDSGMTPDSLTDAFVSQMGFTPTRAGTFVASAVTHYCPQYSNLRFQAPH